ncbi:MAG: hypothetical protein ACLPN1_07455 [Dissulfurispiraceae bacterium]
MKGLSIMRSLMIIVVLLFLPWQSVQAVDMQSGTPSVGQPLVREGTLALQLAESLKIGNPQSEVEAENELSDVGIAPGNGWIMDYPVTPDIAVELRSSIGSAADSKKLTMGRDEALHVFEMTLASSNMNVRPYTSGEKYEPSNIPQPDASAVNGYYSDNGPPVVTYYAPPSDYYYLYSWVPCPFWWGDFWFGGFFILRDFHRVVIINKKAVFISNHFNDVETHRVFRIDPISRFKGKSFAGIGAPRNRTFMDTGIPGSERQIFNSPDQRVERQEGSVELSNSRGQMMERSSGDMRPSGGETGSHGMGGGRR